MPSRTRSAPSLRSQRCTITFGAAADRIRRHRPTLAGELAASGRRLIAPANNSTSKFGHLMISRTRRFPWVFSSRACYQRRKHATPMDPAAKFRSRGETARRRATCRGLGSRNRASRGISISPSRGQALDVKRHARPLLGQLDGLIHGCSSNQPKGAGIQLDLPRRPSVVIGDQTPSERSRSTSGMI